MKKFKVCYKNVNGVIIEYTFENLRKALNYISTGFKFGITLMTIEECKTKENK